MKPLLCAKEVSSGQNLRKFKQIINLDIHIFTILANKSENIDADQNMAPTKT
jgi:hypothetical protein